MARDGNHRFLIKSMLNACLSGIAAMANPLFAEVRSESIDLSRDQIHTFSIKTFDNAVTVLNIEEIELSARYSTNATEELFSSQCFSKNLFKQRQFLFTTEDCKNCSLSARAWTTHQRNGKLNYTYDVVRANTRPKQYQELLERREFCKTKHKDREAAHQKLQQLYQHPSLDSRSIEDKLALEYELFQTATDNPQNWLHKILQTAAPSKNTYAHTMALIQLGRFHNKRGEFSKAQDYFDRARHILADEDCCGAPHRYEIAAGSLEHEQGQLYLISKQLEKALPHLQQAELHFSNAADSSELVFALNTLGYYYRTRRTLPDAFAYHSLAAQLLEYSHPTMGMEMSCAYFLGTLGVLTGQYYYALELLDRAEHLALQQNDYEWHGHIVAAVARAYRELGNISDSLIAYETALQSYKKAGAKPQYITIYAHFAEIYAELGDEENTHKYLALSQAEINNGQTDSLHSRWLHSAQIDALLNRGHLQQALELQLEMIAKLEQEPTASEDAFSLGRYYTRLASIYRKLKAFKKAREAAEHALRLQQQNLDELYLIESYFEAAQSALQQKVSIDTVHSYTNPALHRIEQQRTNLHSDDLKRQYFDLQRLLYDVKVQSLLQDNNRNATGTNVHLWLESLYTAESYKARTLLEAMLQNDFQNLKSSPLKHSSDLQVNVATGKKYFTNIFSGQATPETDASRPFSTSADLERYLKTLDSSTALLFFYLAGPEIVVWGYHNGKKIQHRAHLNSGFLKRLEKAISDLHKKTPTAWTAKTLLQQHELRLQISNALLSPLEPVLSGSTQLLVIADGPLHKFPLGLLPHPRTQEPLLSTHTLRYQASLATDRRLQDVPGITASHPKMLLVANPQLSTSDSRTTQWMASRRSGFSQNTSLPFTLVEAEKIRALWPANSNSILLSGPDATKAQFVAALKKEFEIIHIASHAEVNWQYPPLSALLLAPEAGRSQHSGRFSAQEIANLNIPTNLVVLSACSTGSGKTLAGEGPMALSRAFFESGTRRVIASLWAVEDESTSYLFENFYRNLLVGKLPPEESLRKAQLKVSQIPKWSHPYYWAGFVFIGKRNES